MTHRKTWTTEEISTLRAVWGTSTPIADIALLFEGRGVGAIRGFASVLGLKRVAKVPRPSRQKYKIEVRDGVEGKKCSDCDWRPLTKFAKKTGNANGLANICSTCQGRNASKKYPERLRAAALKYQWKNRPEFLLKAKVIGHRRRARIRACETDVTEQALRDLFTVYEHTCAYCFERATTIDHVEPLSRGGLHKLSNLVPACMDCNRRKHTRSVEEFISQKQSKEL